MPVDIPDFVTHYYLAGRAPFLNLSELSGDALTEVLAALDAERAEGISSRVFGRRYMDLRLRTEAKLRALFIEAGGRPERPVPHYFVLGSSPWYQGLARRMREVVLPWASFPTEVASFTYPDSVTAMGLGSDYGLALHPQPYHGLVYRLEELPGVVRTYGLPGGDGPGHGDENGYEDYAHKPFEKYVEVQLWSDEPLPPQWPTRP